MAPSNLKSHQVSKNLEMEKSLSSNSNNVKNANNNKDWVSELPLVFTKGLPKSLELLALAELKRFLLFVLQCCEGQGRKVTSLEDIKHIPDWWPDDTPFNNLFFHLSLKKTQMCLLLRKVIRTCYKHYNAIYLLEFSGRLMNYTKAPTNYSFSDNQDGTRTLINLKNGKPLVTFRAENQDYDSEMFANTIFGENSSCEHSSENEIEEVVPSHHQQLHINSPRSLQYSYSSNSSSWNQIKLQKTFSAEGNLSDPRLPAIKDVFLCDTCEKDFESMADLMHHEKICDNKNCIKTQSEMDVMFFQHYGLRKKTSSRNENDKDDKFPKPMKLKRPKVASYAKFLSIPLTSPLGNYILGSQDRGKSEPIDLNSVTSGLLKKSGKSKNNNNQNKKKKQTIGPLTTRNKHKTKFVHLYCFSLEERRRKFISLETGLSPRSLWLYNMCKKRKIDVKVLKLSPSQVQKKILSMQTKHSQRHFNNFITPSSGISKDTSVMKNSDIGEKKIYTSILNSSSNEPRIILKLQRSVANVS